MFCIRDDDSCFDGGEEGLQSLCLFVSGIENLPCDLRRNFQLMRELDQRTEGMLRYSSKQSE